MEEMAVRFWPAETMIVSRSGEGGPECVNLIPSSCALHSDLQLVN